MTTPIVTSNEKSLLRWLIPFIGVFLPVSIFVSLAIAVVHGRNGFPFDESILLAIHRTAQPQLDKFASIFTNFGMYWGVIPVLTVIGIFLFFSGKWRSLIYLLFTAVGSFSLTYTAKAFFQRLRPHLWESFYPLPLDFAFPSGHAMCSMMFFVVLVVLTKGSRWYPLVLAGGSLFVLGIGWSRIYLGVHYPSDIVAGWMVAIAWGIFIKQLLDFIYIK